MPAAEGVPATAAGFYFDLASPLAYLVAERILQVLPAAAEWRPVLARDLRGPGEGVARAGASAAAWSAGGSYASGDVDALREHVERRARELGLQPLRWPDPFPFDSALAMRAAAYAASIGRAVAFAQAAFRQAFAGGRSLGDPDTVLIAAAACEMHPKAVVQGAQLRSSAEQLARAAASASSAGVSEVPAVLIAGEAFLGEDAPERAAAHMLAGGARR